ncbi:sensor histidine kinase [Echinimonas agarilytica]|uniref:Two-component system, sensor histidine kinase RegB n=1 Tax=Echinimonas agarilytica TaxID=1215918 RepID=A0AA42B5W3_9GAMM|nr:hypothetical protein [Echinimonas agarilytica]MCM2678145.1 hypothetical protein [Echinimonas agarilytica]
MMKSLYIPTERSAEQRHLRRVLQLRWVLIALEIILLSLDSQGEWIHFFGSPIGIILGMQLALQLLSEAWMRSSNRVSLWMIGYQLVLDVGCLSGLIYFTGGATNAFVSALLIPVALAGVMLPMLGTLLVLAVAAFAYSSMVFWLPNEMHHIHDMHAHFVGMWVNFLISAFVMTFVIAVIARELRQRDAQLSEQKLQALRQHQVLSMGAAAAQTAHELATPIATLSMLHEELSENYPTDTDIAALAAPLKQCQSSLSELRQVADELRLQQVSIILADALFTDLVERVRLLWPTLELQVSHHFGDEYLKTDSSVLPALINLTQNAAQSAELSGCPRISIDGGVENGVWCCQIRNPIDELHQLHQPPGGALVASNHGFGMAQVLSRTVIERFGGSLYATVRDDEMCVEVRLPVEAA